VVTGVAAALDEALVDAVDGVVAALVLAVAAFVVAAFAAAAFATAFAAAACAARFCAETADELVDTAVLWVATVVVVTAARRFALATRAGSCPVTSWA
jgi:hypothetical protein